MVILVRVGVPQFPQHGKFQLFSSVFPVVIKYLGKILVIRHSSKLFVFPLNKACHPVFSPRQSGIFACPFLQLNKGFGEEVRSKHYLSIELEFVSMALEKDMVNFIELIALKLRQIQILR